MTSTTGFATVPRVSRVAGRVRVPGDKSISHRYAMLAAIAEGEARLTGYAPRGARLPGRARGGAGAAPLACLEALGARVGRLRPGPGEPGTIVIEGRGPQG